MIAAPDGFALTAPHDVRAGRVPYDVVLLFCSDLAGLRRRWPAALDHTAIAGALWVAWPKRASGVPTDLTENVVRDFALPHGVVDVKVAAIDQTWSGLKLVRRLANRAAPPPRVDHEVS